LGLFIVLKEALDGGPEKGDPGDQAAEVVADGGRQGVGGVAGAAFELVTVHAVIGFKMIDDRSDG
jgi:hypothetical protein